MRCSTAPLECACACWPPPAVIIPTISPTAACLHETASTLKFAARAKQVRNRAVVNEDVSQSAVDMAAELQRLRQEVAMLRSLQTTSPGGSSAELQQALAVNAELEGRLKHLEGRCAELRQ